MYLKIFFFSLVFLFTVSSYSATPSSNPASAGSQTMSGASDKPLGPEQEASRESRMKAGSMGGAPNAGGGMGTGTGAGSSVGKPTGKGTIGAGAMGDPEEEMQSRKEE